MEGSAKEICTFCNAPLFELAGQAFFENNLASQTDREGSDSEESETSHTNAALVSGHVCGNGHLTFAITRFEGCRRILKKKRMAGSGEQMTVETFGVFDAVVLALGSQLDSNNEADFRKNMNAFTVASKLRRLANETDYETSDEKGSHKRQGRRSLGKLQTMPELIAGIPDIARRACKIIEDFESGFEESSESDSDAGSEEEESGDVHPFWEVPFAELEIVMDFLPAVPNDSVGILATYLGRGTLCARTVVRAVRNLRRLNALGEEATQRLGAIEAQRKAQIEAALEKAGVRGFGGAWPVSEAVYNYVRVSFS